MMQEDNIPPDLGYESMSKKQGKDCLQMDLPKNSKFEEFGQQESLETDAVPESDDASLSRTMRRKLNIAEVDDVVEFEDDAEKDETKKVSFYKDAACTAEINPCTPVKRCRSINAANFSRGGIQDRDATEVTISERSEGTHQQVEECRGGFGVEGAAPSVTNKEEATVEAKAEAPTAVSKRETSKKLVAAVTPQKCPQTASESQLPPPHTPVEETAIPAKAQPSPPPDDTPEKEFYDVLLLHSEHDTGLAEQFKGMAARLEWKVVSTEDFLPNLSKFDAFSLAFEQSTYTVLLLTENFRKDVWCEKRYQVALVQSIEDLQRKDSVIPVVCEKGFKMPMELSILTSTTPTAPKYENIMKRSIKIEKRLKREREAGLSPNPSTGTAVVDRKPSNQGDASSLQIDDIYRRRRPELQPSDFAIRVFSQEVFLKICLKLDTPHALDKDWHGVAEEFGFSQQSIELLQQEKGPTAQVLNCVCEQNLGKGVLAKDIFEKFKKVLQRLQRTDVLTILNN